MDEPKVSKTRGPPSRRKLHSGQTGADHSFAIGVYASCNRMDGSKNTEILKKIKYLLENLSVLPTVDVVGVSGVQQHSE